MGDQPEDVSNDVKMETTADSEDKTEDSVTDDKKEEAEVPVKMEEEEEDEDDAGEPEDPEEAEEEEIKDEAADSADIKEEGEEEEKDTEEPADVQGKQDESEKEEPTKVHPYKHLVDNFEIPLLCKTKISKYKVKPMDRTPCVFVSTKTYLQELSEQLMLEKEIGVAVKYNYQSYFSRLCVLLISTRRSNYIIDSIKLQKNLHLLGEVFTNPNIVKIMYSSLKILRNLQLDHNLWFVNIFDVQLAMKRLGLKESYREYIERRYNVKRYNEAELSRWHVRPLAEDYRINAIITMHCLIPTFFDLKNKLLDAKPDGMMESVMMECNKRCGYIFQPTRTLEAMYPNIQFLPPNQVAAIFALNDWRHLVARKRKKNVNFVLSKIQMTKLATEMPTKLVQILKIADSPQVKNSVKEIQEILILCKKVIGPVNSRFGGGVSIAKTKDVEHDKATETKDEADDNKKQKAEQNAAKNFKKAKPMFKRYAVNKKAQFGKIQQNRMPERGFGQRFGGPRRGGGGGFDRGGGRFGGAQRGRSPGRFRAHSPFASSQRNRSPPRHRSPPGDMRSRSPPSYIIVSRNGETLEVNNSNVLDRYFNSGPSRGPFERDRSPHRNTTVWETDRSNNRSGTLDSINTLINLSSSLMKLGRQGSFNDSGRDFGRNDRGFNQNSFGPFGGGGGGGMNAGNGFGSPGNQANRPSPAANNRNYVPTFSSPPKGFNEVVSYPRYNPSRYNNQGY